MKTETEVLRECCEYLYSIAATRSEVIFWRVNNIPVYGRALPKFTPKGLPDIMAIVAGRFYGIECKRPFAENDEREKNGRKVRGGKLSAFQSEWATNCVLAGGHYVTVRSVQELKAILQ